MADLDLARQLVTYVDATTEPVSLPIRQEDLTMLSPSQPPSHRRTWMLVAAAVVAVAGLGALLLLTTSGDDSIDEIDRPTPSAPPETIGGDVDEPEPPPSVPAESIPDAVDTSSNAREQAALAIAERYLAAFSTNDDDTVVALSDEAIADADVDAVRWWWLTARSEAEPTVWPSAACVVDETREGFGVRVTCPIAVGDPVAAALGLDSLTWSVVVGDDGLVRRDPAPTNGDGAAYSQVWRAYAEYLSAHRATSYSESCAPVATRTPIAADGMTLDGVCAQLAASVSEVVALWITHRDEAPAALVLGDLVGYWANTSGFNGLIVDFRRNGTFTIGNTGRITPRGAFASGTYDIDDSGIRFIVGDDSNNCVGETWTWQVTTPFDGLWEVEILGNGGCAESSLAQFTRFSPTSPAAGLIDTTAAGRDQPDRIPAPVIVGIWLRVGSGEVLVVEDDRSYWVTREGDTLSPIDAGTLSSDRSGEWVFTSSGDGACAAGTVLTWTGVTMPDGALDADNVGGVRISAPTTPTCGSVEGGGEWRLVAPESS